MNTYYVLLGLDNTKKPTEPQIREAYRLTALLCHPDLGGDQVLFDLVKAVTDILLDKELRKKYDRFGSEKELIARNDLTDSDEIQFPTLVQIGNACEILEKARQEKIIQQQTKAMKEEQKAFAEQYAMLTDYQYEIKTEQESTSLKIIQAIFKKREDLVYLELFDWMIKLSDIASLAPRSSELNLSLNHEKIYRAIKLLALAVKPEGLKTVQKALEFLQAEKDEIGKKHLRGVLSHEDFQNNALALWAAETYYSSFVIKKSIPSSNSLFIQLLGNAKNIKNQVILMRDANFYDVRSILLSETSLIKLLDSAISIHLLVMSYIEKFRESVTDIEQEQMIDDDTANLAASLFKIAKNQPNNIHTILKQLINVQNNQTIFIQQLYRKLVGFFFNSTLPENSPQRNRVLINALDELGERFLCEQKNMWPFFIEMRAKSLTAFSRCTRYIIERPLTPEWLLVACECNEPIQLEQMLGHYVNQENATTHFEKLLFDLMIQYKDSPRKIVFVIQTILPFFTNEAFAAYKNTLILASQYLSDCLLEEQAENKELSIVGFSKNSVLNAALTAPSRIFLEDAILLEDAQVVLSALLMKINNAFIWKGFLGRLDLTSCMKFLFKLEKNEVVAWHIRTFLIQALCQKFEKDAVNSELLNVLINNRSLLNQMLLSLNGLTLDESKRILKENLVQVLEDVKKEQQILEEMPALEKVSSLPEKKSSGLFSGISSLFQRSISDSPRMYGSKNSSAFSQRAISNTLQARKNIHEENTRKYGAINEIDQGAYVPKSPK